MRIAVTSGGLGDIVISVPVMQAMGITDLHIKESYYPDGSHMHSVAMRLIELQGIQTHGTKDEGLGFDRFDPQLAYHINMDSWRSIRGRGRDYIGLSMRMHFRISARNYQVPWLTGIIATPLSSDYSLFYLTPRWRQNPVNWEKLYHSVSGEKYFIGIEQDHKDFEELVGTDVPWWKTKDLLEMAQAIIDSKALYCNQGVALAIAQGLGTEYYCAFKEGKTNCRLYTKNEHDI